MMISNIHYNRTRTEDASLIDGDSVDLSPVMRKPLDATTDEHKGLDNEHLVSFLNGVEANPYLDAFYAILSQVCMISLFTTHFPRFQRIFVKSQQKNQKMFVVVS